MALLIYPPLVSGMVSDHRNMGTLQNVNNSDIAYLQCLFTIRSFLQYKLLKQK